jgi:hypothetical protein
MVKSIIMKHVLFIVLGVLFSFRPALAQEVWPGDVNNNGVVSMVDLLYWGVAHGNAGTPRPEESTEWIAQPVDELWGQSFPGGPDLAFADCDGNGFVEEDDFDAIEDNFGLIHGTVAPDNYGNGSPGLAPRLILEPSDTLVQEGDAVTISLRLEDSGMPIDQFYGLAFTLSYTAELLEDDADPDFDLTEDNWIEADDSYVQDLFFYDDDLGKAAVGVTRTNQIAIPATTDLIGNFSVVIEDIIVGLTVDTFVLQIDSVRLIDQNLTTIPVVPDTTQIIITSKPLGNNGLNVPLKFRNPTDLLWAVEVFPNPVTDHFFIQTQMPVEKASLIDCLGRKIPLGNESTAEGEVKRYECPPLSPGVYWLQLESRLSIMTKKIIIN